jgi:hypothetical protein
MRINRLSLVPCCLLALSACSSGDVVRSFGLTRDAPDEFQVTTRAPLSMPPDFTLRPPEPGAARPQEMSQRDQAQATLVPDTALGSGSGGDSAGQQALVEQAGPAAPADIRRRVDADSALDAGDPTLVDRLMFWRKSTAPVEIDAGAEAQRLRANAATGQSPVAGDTPIIQPKKSSFLGSIF